MRTSLLAVAVLALVHVVSAQAPGLAQGKAKTKAAVPKIDCAEAVATPELSHCAEIRLRKAESELGVALAKARARIAKSKGAAPYDPANWTMEIEATQKAWAGFREADCKGLVPYEWQGGTGATLAVLECLAQMTEVRAFELSERYRDGR